MRHSKIQNMQSTKKACANSWVFFWFNPLPAIFCSSYVLCIFLSCIHNLFISVYMPGIMPSIIIICTWIGYMWQRRRWHVLEKILNVVWMTVLPTPTPAQTTKMLHLHSIRLWQRVLAHSITNNLCVYHVYTNSNICWSTSVYALKPKVYLWAAEGLLFGKIGRQLEIKMKPLSSRHKFTNVLKLFMAPVVSVYPQKGSASADIVVCM